MENLAEILKNRIPKEDKKAKYRWQDLCIEIAKEAQVHKGIAFKLWTLGGYQLLEEIQSQFRQGLVKNKTAYVLSLLKK